MGPRQVFDGSTVGVDVDTRLYRNGAIEGVDAVLLRRTDQGKRHLIPSVALEKTLIERQDNYFTLLREFEVPGPFVVALSLLGVRGLEMAVDVRRFDDGHPIDRDDLIVPETLIGELTEAPASGVA